MTLTLMFVQYSGSIKARIACEPTSMSREERNACRRDVGRVSDPERKRTPTRRIGLDPGRDLEESMRVVEEERLDSSSLNVLNSC